MMGKKSLGGTTFALAMRHIHTKHKALPLICLFSTNIVSMYFAYQAVGTGSADWIDTWLTTSFSPCVCVCEGACVCVCLCVRNSERK